MVEIAKAIGRKPSVLILDEATSALTARDVETVYALLAELKAEGVASIFISHRMHEVEALCDTLSVFRNGRHIETFAKGARSAGRDRPPDDRPRRRGPVPAEARAPAPPAPFLAVDNLTWEDRLKGVDLSVGKGEIVGLGGLDGQGQKELLLALFGVLRGVTGEVTVGASARHPRLARRGQVGPRPHRPRARRTARPKA